MQSKQIDVDLTKAFTLYEACPKLRCRDPQRASAPQFPPPTCPKCNGARGRTTAFASLVDLAKYVAEPHPW